MQGSPSEHWAQVASERGADAKALHVGGRELGSIYMLGFAIEAYAKALAIARGSKVLKVHDIVQLIEVCGFKVQDLPADAQYFARWRTVDIRYDISLPAGTDYASLQAAGNTLASWLSRRLNRTRR